MLYSLSSIFCYNASSICSFGSFFTVCRCSSTKCCRWQYLPEYYLIGPLSTCQGPIIWLGFVLPLPSPTGKLAPDSKIIIRDDGDLTLGKTYFLFLAITLIRKLLYNLMCWHSFLGTRDGSLLLEGAEVRMRTQISRAMVDGMTWALYQRVQRLW